MSTILSPLITPSSTYIPSLLLAGHPTMLQVCHGSVLDFSKIRGANGDILGTWLGYRFWFGYTPSWEGLNNLYLKVSNDPPSNNQVFVNAPITNNALYPDLNVYVGGGDLNDDELVYDPIADCIHVYYCHESFWTVANLYRITINNTGAIIANEAVPSLIVGQPTVVRVSATDWRAWGVTFPDPNAIRYQTSSDGFSWGYDDGSGWVEGYSNGTYSGGGSLRDESVVRGMKVCTIPWDGGLWPIHIQAKLNPYIPNGHVDIILTVRNGTTIDYQQAYARASLGNPTNIDLFYSKIINPASWAPSGYYRSTFTTDLVDTDKIQLNLWSDNYVDGDSDAFSFQSGILGSIASLTISTTTPAASLTGLARGNKPVTLKGRKIKR